MKDTTTLYYLDHTGITSMELTKQQHDEFQGSGTFHNSMKEAIAYEEELFFDNVKLGNILDKEYCPEYSSSDSDFNDETPF